MTLASIRSAQSQAPDARDAVREFHAAVAQPDMALVLFFCSSAHDLNAVAAEMNRLFGDTVVLGCTTAGEIGPQGYLSHSLSGVSLCARDFTVAHGLLSHLGNVGIAESQRLARELLADLSERAPQVDADNTFGLLLIDGLCTREELVAHGVQHALGNIRLIGGSAGDDMQFKRSHIFSGGRFHTDCAQLILVSTPLPFKVFKSQHFIADSQRMVVTGADPVQRVVHEINGLPAAPEYARLLGLEAATLGPSSFASTPVVVMMDGTEYVRSIKSTNADGSLTFFCAIEEGLVLRVAHGVGILGNLGQTFDDLQRDIGEIQLALVSDCILRNVELAERGEKALAGSVFQRHHAVGFSSYGEQYLGVHVNQTLTGVAIGAGRV